jgi:histidine triad (HIT) family protein
LNGYLTFCKPIAAAIKKAYPCDRVNIITIGFEIPHAHIHLIPMNGMGDTDILHHKLKAGPEFLKQVQERILASF